MLLVIPTAFAAAAVLGSALDVSFHRTVAGASFVALPAVVDALFVNPLREPSGGGPRA